MEAHLTEITIKIKLTSGKEIELTDEEYKELRTHMERIVFQPYYVPYYPEPQPTYPYYLWHPTTMSIDKTTAKLEPSSV